MEANLEIVRMKKITGYDNYFISEEGDVYNCKTNKFLKQCKTRNGYYYVKLCKDGTIKHHYIHRLVAMAFIPNPNGYDTVDHKDSNKENNKASNLQWMTAEDNSRKALNKPIGQYTVYGELIKVYKSVTNASAETGINLGNIATCARGGCNNKGYRIKTIGGFVWKYI